MSHLHTHTLICRQAVHTCRCEGGRAQQEVGAGAADEAHHIVGGLQVVPEPDVLMVQHVIRPVHSPEDLQVKP